MAKRRLTLHVRIPPYRAKRNAWRRKLHSAISTARRTRRVEYTPNDMLQLDIRLYIAGNALRFHDVDNRLKDVMDALQGRAGGPKGRQALRPIIHNDQQVYRVVMEKAPPPSQSRGFGHLTVRKLRRPKWA